MPRKISRVGVNTLGGRVKSIRNARNYTLATLAKRAQVAPSTLSDIERSIITNPGVDTLERIAAALDVVAAYLQTAAPPGAADDVVKLHAEMPPLLRAKWIAHGRDMLEIWRAASRRKSTKKDAE